MRILLRILLVFSFSLMFYIVQAQRCAKRELASKEILSDFDYRGQSYYNEHRSGDTVRVNAVIYAKQDYRVFAVSDPKLGPVHFRVTAQTKAIRNVVKEIVQQKTSKGMVNDTLWTKETYNTETVVYDNLQSPDKKFWETNTPKTRLVNIEVILPRDRSCDGCVQVMIGRKFSSSRKVKG